MGKLKHHNCILFAHPSDTSQLPQVLKIKNGRVNFHKKWNLDGIDDLFLLPDDLPKSPYDTFSLLKVKNNHLKRQGLLMKINNHKNQRRFTFISSKSLSAYNKHAGAILYHLLKEVDFKNKDFVLSELYQKLRQHYSPAKQKKSEL